MLLSQCLQYQRTPCSPKWATRLSTASTGANRFRGRRGKMASTVDKLQGPTCHWWCIGEVGVARRGKHQDVLACLGCQLTGGSSAAGVTGQKTATSSQASKHHRKRRNQQQKRTIVTKKLHRITVQEHPCERQRQKGNQGSAGAQQQASNTGAVAARNAGIRRSFKAWGFLEAAQSCWCTCILSPALLSQLARVGLVLAVACCRERTS